MKTRQDIIRETVEFYGEDVSRRSVSSDGLSCFYLDPDGKRCAFSRYCKEGQTFTEGDSANSQLRDGVVLKDEYAHLSNDMSFWLDLQSLHDGDYNWNSEGLSEEGERNVKNLMRKYQ